MTKLPTMPNNRTPNERFDRSLKVRAVAEAEDPRAGQRLFADYDTRLQYGGGRVLEAWSSKGAAARPSPTPP